MARIYLARSGSEGDLLHGPDVVNTTVEVTGRIVLISATSGMQTVGIGQIALADGVRYVNISTMGISFNNETPTTAGQGFSNGAIWQELFDEIESGNALPTTSLTNGRVFWLIQTSGDNAPGLYRYNTASSAWETAAPSVADVEFNTTTHSIIIDGTSYNIGSFDGRTTEQITEEIEAAGTEGGLHLLSDVDVTGIGGDVRWGEVAGSGTGGSTRITVNFTTVDSTVQPNSIVFAHSPSRGFTYPFRIFDITATQYRFVQGPRTFYNTFVGTERIGSTADFNSAFNAINDWQFTHAVDEAFHLIGAGDGITIEVDNDEAIISSPGLRVGPGSVFDFMNIRGFRSDPATGNKLSIAQVGDDAANNRVSINVRDEILGIVTDTLPTGIFPGDLIDPGYVVSFSNELYLWQGNSVGILTQAAWDINRPGVSTNWVRITQSGSRIQQGSQIYTEFGGLLFVSRIGDLQVQNVNVTSTGTTIAYPTALAIADGNFIMAEYPGLGVVFYRVEVDGTTVTNHQYTSVGVDGGTFTVPNGAYTDIRYARLEDVVVPAGWFGVISGRTQDDMGRDVYNNNGTPVLVNRVTTGGDFWTITTAYDGTDGTDLTTTIATR